MENKSEMKVKIGGMTCVMCSRGIQGALKRMKGVLSAEVNHVAGSALITYDKDLLALDDVKNIIQDMGYQFLAGEENQEVKEDVKKKR